jgi:hypothetical protein
MSAAHKGLAQGPVYRASSYSHLSKRDTTKLVRILRDSPLPCDDVNSEKTQKYIQNVKKLVQRLPPHLLRNGIALKIGNIFTPKSSEPSRGRLCHGLHEKLQPKLVHSIFSWIKYEVETGIPIFLFPLYLHDALTPEQEKFMRYIELIPEMWQASYNAKDTSPPNRQPKYAHVRHGDVVLSRWAKGLNPCPACMLARIGGSFRASFALLLGMLARMRTDRIKEGSCRVMWAERWVNLFSKYPENDRSFIVWAWDEALKMKEARKTLNRKVKAGEIEDPWKRTPKFPVDPEIFLPENTSTSPFDISEPFHPNDRFTGQEPKNPFERPSERPPASPPHGTNEQSEIRDSVTLVNDAEDDTGEPWYGGSNPYERTYFRNGHPAASSIYSQDDSGPAAASSTNLRGASSAMFSPSVAAAYEDEPLEGDAPPTQPLFARDTWINYNVDNYESGAQLSNTANQAPAPYVSVFHDTLKRAENSRRPEPRAIPTRPEIHSNSRRPPPGKTGMRYEFELSPVSSSAPSLRLELGEPYDVSPLQSPNVLCEHPVREGRDSRGSAGTARTRWSQMMPEYEKDEPLPELQPVPKILQNPFANAFPFKGRGKGKNKGKDGS